MKLRHLYLVAFCFALSACVTSSPEALFKIPEAPQGQGKKTGQFPKIGDIPQGQTPQITAEEVEATKGQLQQDVQRGEAQASQNNEAAYQSEVEALKRLAAEQKKKRQADIESREFE